jgi:hypothetical protein
MEVNGLGKECRIPCGVDECWLAFAIGDRDRARNLSLEDNKNNNDDDKDRGLTLASIVVATV